MAAQDGRGWHGDSEGHREAAEERNDTNWWPLLFIPVAFLVGWWANDTVDNASQNQARNNQAETGVGGGPDSTTISPEASGQ